MLLLGLSSKSARTVLSTLRYSRFLRRYHIRSAEAYVLRCDHLSKGMSVRTERAPGKRSKRLSPSCSDRLLDRISFGLARIQLIFSFDKKVNRISFWNIEPISKVCRTCIACWPTRAIPILGFRCPVRPVLRPMLSASCLRKNEIVIALHTQIHVTEGILDNHRRIFPGEVCQILLALPLSSSLACVCV